MSGWWFLEGLVPDPLVLLREVLVRNEEVHLDRLPLEGGGHPEGASVDPADARFSREQLHTPLDLLALGGVFAGAADQEQVGGRQDGLAANLARMDQGDADGLHDLPQRGEKLGRHDVAVPVEHV